MIRIQPLRAGQVNDAKYVITAVAQRIFEPDRPVEVFYAMMATEYPLDDVDNYQREYVENGGIFLVVLDGDRVVGTGALKKLEGTIAELKRLWLLEEYHGRKIGYQVVSRLLEFGRTHGYERVRLQSSKEQKRAIHFYRRMGFIEIPSYQEDTDDISMELIF